MQLRMYTLYAQIVIAVIGNSIYAAPVSEKVCPNGISYIWEDMCYSLHPESNFQYKDAVQFCLENNGILGGKQSEDEVIFLRKLLAKFRSAYWVGSHKVNNSWNFLSNESAMKTEVAVKHTRHQSHRCLAMRQTEKTLLPFSCKHNSNSICEIPDEQCDGGKDYWITKSESPFINANDNCSSDGGKLVEIQSAKEFQSIQEFLRTDREFENISHMKLQLLDGSMFPTLWKRTDKISDGLCEIYENWEEGFANCTHTFISFVCQYEAIAPVVEETPNRCRRYTTTRPTNNQIKADSIKNHGDVTEPVDIPNTSPKIDVHTDTASNGEIVTVAVVVGAISLMVGVVIALSAVTLVSRRCARNQNNRNQIKPQNLPLIEQREVQAQ